MPSPITFVRRKVAGDHGGDAEASPGGDAFGQSLGAEVVVIIGAGKGVFAGQGGKSFFHRLQQRPDQAGFEFAGGLGAPSR